MSQNISKCERRDVKYGQSADNNNPTKDSQFSPMSQAELPRVLQFLPTEILEKPSLEDQSDLKQSLKQSANKKIPIIKDFEKATLGKNLKKDQKAI